MLSSEFTKRWENRDGSRIKAVLKPTPSLKTKIQTATRRVNTQIQQLENTINKLTTRDTYLFSKVVDAFSKNQIQRANVFANELAELRKMANLIMNSQLALERVVLRLNTATDLGDLMVTLAPASNVLKSVKSGIAGILPNAEKNLSNIGTLLDDIMVDAGQTMGITPQFDVANEDARKILEEASLVTEERMKNKFPELPTLKQREEGYQEDIGYSQQ
jgi:division protein CdvB (Snf7/Vps24/ESCRT-III family)